MQRSSTAHTTVTLFFLMASVMDRLAGI